MRPLFDYIAESLKKVGEFRPGKSDSSDIIQISERSFKEGSLSTQEIVKLIVADVKECFKLTDSKLNKEYDKVIEALTKEAVNKQLDDIKKLAERQYKTQSRRNQYVEKALSELREKVLRYNPKHTIDRVSMQLNPISGFGSKGVAKDGGVKLWGDFVLGSDTEDVLARWLDTFGYHDKDGKEVDLKDQIVGWNITYNAHPGTKCPKYNNAYLELVLTKEGQAIVDKHNRGREDAISAYYASKGTGGYTGD